MGSEPRIEDRPDAPTWGVDEATLARWDALTPGTAITIVKRSAKHGGAERARYPATVVTSDLPSPWLICETHWTMGRHDQGLLVFENGDLLQEIFSPIHPYDLFTVFDPHGRLKGWYGNVAWPAVLETEGDAPVLVWHDLFVDIVAAPDGRMAIEDEDELDESGLATSDPELHARVLAARDELIARFRTARPPFGASSRLETHDPPLGQSRGMGE